MVDDPYLAQVITGLSFLVLAFGLLRLASRTGAAAERLLAKEVLPAFRPRAS